MNGIVPARGNDAVNCGGSDSSRRRRQTRVSFKSALTRDDLGQWTSGDGGGNDGEDPLQTPTIGDNSEKPTPVADHSKYGVNLHEEDQRGGHGERDHIGKSEDYLRGVLKDQTWQFGVGPFRTTYGKLAEGSFDSLESANTLVNETLDRNSAQVDKVIVGKSDEEVLKTRFGYRTGYEAYRAAPANDTVIRDTYGVVVLVRRDSRSPNGFTVKTAYPWNRNAN